MVQLLVFDLLPWTTNWGLVGKRPWWSKTFLTSLSGFAFLAYFIPSKFMHELFYAQTIIFSHLIDWFWISECAQVFVPCLCTEDCSFVSQAYFFPFLLRRSFSFVLMGLFLLIWYGHFSAGATISTESFLVLFSSNVISVSVIPLCLIVWSENSHYISSYDDCWLLIQGFNMIISVLRGMTFMIIPSSVFSLILGWYFCMFIWQTVSFFLWKALLEIHGCCMITIS